MFKPINRNCSFLGVQDSIAAGFRLNGHLNYTTYRNLNEYKKTDRWFIVETQLDKWQITSGYIGDGKGIDYFKAVTDGTNIFEYTRFLKTNSTAEKSVNFFANDSTGSVKTGNIPDFDNSLIQLIWMAFCSDKYLQTNNQKTVSALLGIGGIATKDLFLKINYTPLLNSKRFPRETLI